MTNGAEATRRPLKTREHAVSQRLAHAVARTGLSPNAISSVGLVSGIAAGIFFAATASLPGWERWLWFGGALLVQLRLLANMLDGMVALESRAASPLGELFNEIPDRISDACTLIGLGYAAASIPALGYAAAVAALFTAYVRAFGASLGQGQDFCGPFAKPQRMFFATLVGLYGALAPANWMTAEIAGRSLSIVTMILALVFAGTIVTALRRILRLSKGIKNRNPR
ncbi:MAG: CDP-alcohol phosphatidyltransferase family protein [Verrucomicrobiota bacterium]